MQTTINAAEATVTLTLTEREAVALVCDLGSGFGTDAETQRIYSQLADALYAAGVLPTCYADLDTYAEWQATHPAPQEG